MGKHPHMLSAGRVEIKLGRVLLCSAGTRQGPGWPEQFLFSHALVLCLTAVCGQSHNVASPHSPTDTKPEFFSHGVARFHLELAIHKPELFSRHVSQVLPGNGSYSRLASLSAPGFDLSCSYGISSVEAEPHQSPGSLTQTSCHLLQSVLKSRTCGWRYCSQNVFSSGVTVRINLEGRRSLLP